MRATPHPRGRVQDPRRLLGTSGMGRPDHRGREQERASKAVVE